VLNNFDGSAETGETNVLHVRAKWIVSIVLIANGGRFPQTMSVRGLISVPFYSFHRTISHVVPRNGNGESSLIAVPSCSRKPTVQSTVILGSCDFALLWNWWN